MSNNANSCVHAGALRNGAEYEIHEMNGFGDRGEIAILVNGVPVDIIQILNNRKESRYEASPTMKKRVFVQYLTQAPTLDDVGVGAPKVTQKKK